MDGCPGKGEGEGEKNIAPMEGLQARGGNCPSSSGLHSLPVVGCIGRIVMGCIAPIVVGCIALSVEGCIARIILG